MEKRWKEIASGSVLQGFYATVAPNIALFASMGLALMFVAAFQVFKSCLAVYPQPRICTIPNG